MVDPLVYVSLAAFVVILLALVFFLKRSPQAGEAGQEDENGGVRQLGVRRPVPAGARPRGARQRLVRRPQARQQEDESGEEEEDLYGNVAQSEGKIGAKKMRKLQEKEERKKQREAELAEREEKKKRDALLEEQRKKDDKRREAEEAIRAEEERKMKEEEEKREYEEYLKLKEAFIVEEEGQDAQEDQDTESLLQKFIDHIKQSKVVMLEDLAAHFKLKTQEAIDRVKELQAEGRLTGVIDDRGKFIYITKDELEAVAKFIKQRGRVSIVELAESSNRLINLNPDIAVTLPSTQEETIEA